MGGALDVGWMVPSNFFPVLAKGSGILLDEVELPSHRWTVDLLYFDKPTGLAEGRQVLLEVAPEGWESPIRVPVALD